MLAGRHFAGEEYRSGLSGESVRRRPWCRVACRNWGCGTGGHDWAIGAGHRRVGRYLPGPLDPCSGCGVRRSGRRGRWRGGLIHGVGQRCGDTEHVFGPAASTTTMWRLVDTRIDATHLPSSARPAPRPGRPRGPPVPPGVGGMATPRHRRHHHHRPLRRQGESGTDLEEDLRPSLPARVSWIAPGSLAGKPWPGGRARERRLQHRRRPRRGCCGGRWNRCRRTGDPTPPIPTVPRFWCAAMPRRTPACADSAAPPGSALSSVGAAWASWAASAGRAGSASAWCGRVAAASAGWNGAW